jgi:hypothetical protein
MIEVKPTSRSLLFATAAGLAVLGAVAAPERVGRALSEFETFLGDIAVGAAFAQEVDDDDDEEDDDDAGGDGVGDDDVGNDGADDPDGDDDAGDDMDDPGGDSGPDDAGGDDGDDGGDDDGPGGDDDGPGGDDDGPGGDDDGPGGDDDGPGGDDDGPGGDDDGPGGEDDQPGSDDDDRDDRAGSGSPRGRTSRRDGDDDAPGGAGVRGLDLDSLRIRDGDRDVAGPAALPDGVEVDFEGRWVKAGAILALEADPTSLELARGLGFQVVERHRLTSLGVSIAELRVPRGQQTRAALEAVRAADPATAYDFNHVYIPVRGPGGGAVAAAGQSAAGSAALAVGTVGIIDTGIDTTHPALRASRILQANFAPPEAQRAPAPTVSHGTAVASLLVGGQRAPRLLAANVIGRTAQSRTEMASAESIVRALDWLARNDAPVANISLAGPPNTLVEDAVRRAQARGMIIVAAVGNDGPAAPPLYPSAYEGVVGVTAVDASGAVYRRAGRGAHVDIAARGVGVTVAAPGGLSQQASGTSFAAPVVAAALARQHRRPDPGSARQAVSELMARASDAGARGRDPVYGAGVLRSGEGQP